MDSKSSEGAEMRHMKFDFPVDEHDCLAMDLDDQSQENAENGPLVTAQRAEKGHSHIDDQMVLISA